MGESTPRSAALQVHLPLSIVTRAAALAVPGIVLLGFAAVGRPLVGLLPAGIAFLTLWLLHHQTSALAGAALAAGRASRDSSTEIARLRAEMAALARRLGEHDTELLRAQEVTAFALAKLAESRDPDTGYHLERLRAYSRVLVTHLGRTPKYRNLVTERYATAMYQASTLHDIGKVGISDRILLKPGKLTPEEFAIMRRHTSIGGRTLRAAARRSQDNLFLNLGHEIALYHHERWDGGGYPFGLPGSHIPLAARIVALADVYDALTSDRCYKRPMSHAEARAYIVTQSRAHFDPDVVEAFLTREREFVRIREALSGDHIVDGEDLPDLVRDLSVLGAA